MGGAISFVVLLVEMTSCCFVFFCKGNLSGPWFVVESVHAKDS